MNAAPCSCLVVINFIPEDIMESTSSSVSSPGMPKIYLTPSVSRHFANKSDERISGLHFWAQLLVCNYFRKKAMRQIFIEPPGGKTAGYLKSPVCYARYVDSVLSSL